MGGPRDRGPAGIVPNRGLRQRRVDPSGPGAIPLPDVHGRPGLVDCELAVRADRSRLSAKPLGSIKWLVARGGLAVSAVEPSVQDGLFHAAFAETHAPAVRTGERLVTALIVCCLLLDIVVVLGAFLL